MSKVSTLARPMYSISAAARLLDLPSGTLRWWLDGKQRGDKDYPPVIRAERMGGDAVTWGEFVEAGLLREYRRKRVSLQKMRPFIEGMRAQLEMPYPLAHYRPLIDHASRKLVYELQHETALPPSMYLVEFEGGQMELAPAALQFLDHVDFEPSGAAERYWPAGKQSPVAIDPDIAFGMPQIRGIRTESLAESVDAGESTEEAAKTWGIDPVDVDAALKWEHRHRAA